MFVRRAFSTSTRILYNSAKSGGSGAKEPATTKAPKAAAAPKPVAPSQPKYKGDKYMVPEYFQHDRFSFNEVNAQMDSFRCPQKSNKVPC